MDRKSLKRRRSEDKDNDSHSVQSKVWVNQKMSDLSDAEKMKAVHEKTNELLFKGAARAENNNNNNNSCNNNNNIVEKLAPTEVGAADCAAAETTAANVAADSSNNNSNSNANAAGASKQSLCDLYQLLGDGTIMVRDLVADGANPNLERRKSRCCQRQTLIHDTCVNCTMDLCEECGYSCVECAQFICRSCVTLFGNRPLDPASEDPLCERCQMFYA